MALTMDSGAAPRGRTRRLAEIARRRAAAFRAARRHTFAVRSLRFLLPLLVVGLIGGYVFLLRPEISLRVGAGQLKGKVEVTADDLKMKELSYSGQTKDGGRYDVRAKEALVDLARTGPVRLEHIEGDLTDASGVLTRLKSRRGILDNSKGEMDLLDGVEIDSANGMKARLKSAKVFNKEHRVVSRERMSADTPTGRIEADSMDFETKSRKGTFQGAVAVRVTQTDQTGKAMAGLGRDAKGPLDVRAQRLDVDDNEKLATFSGGVTAAQGDNQLQASGLRITYEGKSTLPGQKPAGDGGEASRVSTITAQGNVIVSAGADRRIQGDAVEFDVKADRALFTGSHVEVTQGKNRLVGRRLFVDRKAGRSSLSAPAEGRTPAGRIQTVFYQADAKPGAAVKAPRAAPGGDNALGMNFKADPNAPFDIQAETLDVNDAQKQAIYRGGVRAQQGEVTITAAELTAVYSGDSGLMTDAQPVKGQSAQISKVEAKTKVVITSASGEEAHGDWATFDVKANTVVMGGKVLLKQGRTVLNGTALFMNTLTGEVNVKNEAGTAALGPALAPLAAPKSAAGPGGLPAVQPDNSVPTAPTGDCAAGRQCLTLFPEDHKKRGKEKVEKIRPKAENWQPQTSPSPVYKAP